MFELTESTSFFLDVEGSPLARLQVLSFDGIESLNTEYAIEVTLVSDHLRFDVSSLLSKKAFLAFNGSKTSGIHGIVYAVRRGTISEHYAEYKILLMPRFTHLRKRTNHRTFINKTVPQIIKTLLEEQGLLENAQFVFKFKESTVYTPREFCCQYGESDADFIHRLCEECGITIHYEFSQSEHLMVFSDAMPFFPKLTPAYLYRPNAGMTTDQMVFKRFDVELLTNASVAAERNYNFKNKKHPESTIERTTSTKANQANEPQLEHYQYPSLGNTQAQTNYQTKLNIERLNANRILAEASSDINTLHSGYYVSIEDYPLVDGLNANEPWLIQQIHHQGRQPQVLEAFASTHSAQSYLTPSLLQKHFKHPLQEELQFTSNSFQQGYRNCLVATPQQIIYRPQYLHLKPRILGTQTALVTGPQNEEIYCDEYGRVKVQFHWDRLGQYDENSSHWVRVSSSWAHDGYGAVLIPRVGMEVRVDFLEGDIDNPIITGALHNGVNKPPYELPANKTKSVFKTSSSKGGVGNNELRIEDRKDQEQIFIQAQKDFDQITKNNHTLQVNNNRHLQVNNESSETIVANHYTHNKAEEHHLTEMDRTVQIIKNDYANIGMSQYENVGMAKVIQAGTEISMQSGLQTVIDAGLSLTLKAGGHHIVLNPSGIWMSMIPKPGGSPTEGAPIKTVSPTVKKATLESSSLDASNKALSTAKTKSATVPLSSVQHKTLATDTPFCMECMLNAQGICITDFTDKTTHQAVLDESKLFNQDII